MGPRVYEGKGYGAFVSTVYKYPIGFYVAIVTSGKWSAKSVEVVLLWVEILTSLELFNHFIKKRHIHAALLHALVTFLICAGED